MEEGNLSNITLAQMMDVSLTGRIVSPVCLVVITSILLLLIFYKTYTTTLQRLFLYLTITTVIQEVSMTVGYAIWFEYSGHKTFCDMINIVTDWSATVVYLLNFGIIVFLPYKVYEQIKGDPFPRLSRSKCCRIALECLFIFIVLVLPLTYIYPWAYCERLLEQWCGMDHSCTIDPNTGQIVMVYFNLFGLMGMIGVVFTIVLSVVFCCVACKYREARQPFLKTLCRTLILLGLFIASTAVTVLVNMLWLSALFSPDSYIYGLVKAAVLPVTQMVFPIGFLFYLYSFNLFHWRTIKRAAAEWRCFRSCCGRENAPRVGQIQEAATAPCSHHVTAPSVTFFDVPHTGAFTDVTTEEQQALLPDGDGDTGYGGVVSAV